MKLSEKLKPILEEVDPKQEIFSEEILNKFSTILEERADELYKEKMDDKKSEIFEEALESIDEDYANKLKEVYEKLDTDHTEKAEKLLEAVDEDHTEKMGKLVEMIDEDHSKKLQEIVESLKDQQIDEQLVDTVSEYFDTYLEETLPETSEVDTEKLKRLEKLFSECREMFAVSDEYMQSEVAEALQEAKEKMDEQTKEINKLMLEKTKLSKNLKENEAQKVLESNIEHLTESEKAYVRRYFKDSSADEISEEAINEAVEAYKADETDTRHANKNDKNHYRKFIKEDVTDDNDNTNDTDPQMQRWMSIIESSKYKG